MKIVSLSSVLAATLLVSSAFAPNSLLASAYSVPVPITPAPGFAPATNPASTPNQTVYMSRLPSAAELSNTATAQGITVERIEQSPTQIVAVYRYSNGQSNTVTYQTLPPSTSSTIVTPTSPPPVVVYNSAPRVVYYRGYDPFWYPPISVRVGFGYGYGGGYGCYGGYGYRGGFYRGGYGYRGGFHSSGFSHHH